jgi:diguanylate cyclase (GGDEF)-like protein/PAS domain S-box-containing protein
MCAGTDMNDSCLPLLEVLNDVGGIVVVVDDTAGYLYFNQLAAEAIAINGEAVFSRLASDSFYDSSFYCESRTLSILDNSGNLREYRFNRIPLYNGKVLCIGYDISGSINNHTVFSNEIQSINDNLPVGIIATDLNFKIKYANVAAINQLKALGCSPCINRHIGEIFESKQICNGITYDDPTCPFVKLVKTGQPFKNRSFSLKGMGKENCININASLHKDSEGNHIGVVFTINDCTEIYFNQINQKKSEEKYRLINEFSPSGIAILKGSEIVYMNPAGAEVLGFQCAQDLKGRNLLDFIDPLKKDDVTNGIAELLTSNDPIYHVSLKGIKADGTSIYMRVSCQPYDNGNEKVIHCVFYDVTNERAGTQEMMRLSQVIEQSPVAVVVTDTEGKIEYVNPATVKMAGYSAEELKGRHASVFKSEMSRNHDYQKIWQTLKAGGTWSGEVCSRAKNGNSYWCFCTLSPVKNDEDEILFYVIIKEDITEKKNREEKIRYMALHDILTGLPNRFLMNDRLNQAVERYNRYGEKVALLFIDLDGFKNINDLYGHSTGDELLKEVSRRILLCIRASDTACRIGGDEFLVIMTDIVSRETLDNVAKRLLLEIGRPFVYEGHKCKVGASIGISLCPEDSVDTDDLIICADEAMYYVKHRTKNDFAYFRDLPK